MFIRPVEDAWAAPYSTTWGDGWVYVRGGALVGVDLPGEGPEEWADTAGTGNAAEPGAPTTAEPPTDAAGTSARAAGTSTQAAGPDGADREALVFWVRELESYFRGERTTWTVAEVPLGELRLGVFERAVYEALLSVPAGETVSYGELAEIAGYPRAARAVGNAMAVNPIPIVVPCHRVIRSDGTMGRYGKDPTWKKRLLVHEGWSAADREPTR